MRLQPSATGQQAERAGAIRLLADISVLCIMPGSVTEILQSVLRRVCEFNGWQAGYAYIEAGRSLRLTAVHIDPVAADLLQRAAPRRLARTADVMRLLLGESGGWSARDDLGFRLPEEYRAVAAPIVADHETVGALLFVSDRKPYASAEMREVMQSLGIQLGRVFERRRLESMVASSARFERERIGRDLHDTVSQELAGLALIADRLARRLRLAGNPEAGAAGEVGAGIRHALEGVHGAVVGLLPMGAGGGDLAQGLHQLAALTEQRFGLRCSAQCDLEIAPSEEAMELHLIASEAVANAARHASAGAIRIRCFETGLSIRLEVIDDGVGLPEDVATRSRCGGRGLSIMAHRARALAGTLTFNPAVPSGTIVTCEVPRHVLHAADDEDEGAQQAVDDPDHR